MQLSLEKIARWVGAELPTRSADLLINGISTDSRSLRPGDLFVPLRGEHFDGHDYLAAAAQAGAAACLTEQGYEGDIPALQVADTLQALGDIAGCWRHCFELPVAAITGTCGKTTTKEMLAAILAETGPGLKTAGNFNNLIGLPLTLCRLTRDAQWAVLELGMNRRGEIARLTEIATPDIGVITNVGPGHLQGLGDLDGVARAKGELFAGLKPGSMAIVNLDDERIARLPVANGVEKSTFGLSESAQVRASEVVAADEHCRFNLHLDGECWPVTLHSAGRHNISNALAAVAIARQLKVAGQQIVSGLERFRPASGRMALTKNPAGWSLLEDFYNANPLSMRAALSTLAESDGGRIAVLGDMLELGSEASTLHREIGAFAASRVDRLVVLGAHARDVAGGAMSAGLAEERIACVADHREAFEQLVAWIQAGDRVLLKGSRGMRMEEIAALLDRQPTAAEGG